MELSGQRGCRIEDRASLDDCKSRDMRGVVSECLGELEGVRRWGIVGWRQSTYAQRERRAELTFLFVLLLYDIEDAGAFSCEARDTVVKVVIKDGFQILWGGSENGRKEREEI